MAGVLVRTAGGTLLFVVFLWLVRIDDYRVAGMMLTFPMLNGIGLVSARENAGRVSQSMVPVITLNGVMCFSFASALVSSQAARSHPGALTALAAVLWLGVYAALEVKDIAFARRSSMLAYVAGCAVASAVITGWLWPSCAVDPGQAAVRAGGLAGVSEGWVTILLFAASLAIVFWFAYRFQNAHAAIGRLAALPMVPLFGLYTVATVLEPDPAALAKLETLRSMILIGWMLALAFALALAAFVSRAAFAPADTFKRMAALVIGWGLCLGGIVVSAKFADQLAACTGS